MIVVASGWLPFSFLCNYSLFSLIFNQVPHHFPSDNRHINKKENHFRIASGTFPLRSGKAVSFVAVMITAYEGGERRAEGREEIKWKNTVAINMLGHHLTHLLHTGQMSQNTHIHPAQSRDLNEITKPIHYKCLGHLGLF